MRGIQISLFTVTESCLLLGLLALAGCGDGKIPTVSVRGKVLVDGKPAGGARVIFCPVEGSKKFMQERPWAETDENGVFELATFLKGDGAPVGEYKVMVRWIPKGRSPQNDEDRDGGGRSQYRGFDRLRGRYFNPDRSGLTATIEEGANELPPFELRSK